jgi:hypothetical protein
MGTMVFVSYNEIAPVQNSPHAAVSMGRGESDSVRARGVQHARVLADAGC